MINSFYSAFVDEIEKLASNMKFDKAKGLFVPETLKSTVTTPKPPKPSPTVGSPAGTSKPKIEKHSPAEQQRRLAEATKQSKIQMGSQDKKPPKTIDFNTLGKKKADSTGAPTSVPLQAPQAEQAAPQSATMDYAQMMMMQQAMGGQGQPAAPKRPWGTSKPRVHEGI